MVERDPDFSAYYDSGVGLEDFVCINLLLCCSQILFMLSSFLLIDWFTYGITKAFRTLCKNIFLNYTRGQ